MKFISFIGLPKSQKDDKLFYIVCQLNASGYNYTISNIKHFFNHEAQLKIKVLIPKPCYYDDFLIFSFPSMESISLSFY